MVAKQYPLRLSKELVEPKGEQLSFQDHPLTDESHRLSSWIELPQRRLSKVPLKETGR